VVVASGLLELVGHGLRKLHEVHSTQLQGQLAESQSPGVQHGLDPIRHEIGLFQDVMHKLADGVRLWLVGRLRLQQLGIRPDDGYWCLELVRQKTDDVVASSQHVPF
jgi:hypothetical protein